MAYTMIEDYTLNFTGGPMTPKGFAIHWWGDPAQKPTFDAILRVLIQAAEAQRASVNFMAEAGKVACLVDPFTVAWGQGDGATGWGNNNLVSIECNPRCTAADRETVAELIADQHIRNGIPIVLYPHNKFTATQCPGVWEQYIPWLTTRAKQIVAEKTNKTTTKVSTVDAVIAYIKALAYGGWNDDKGVKHPGFMWVNENNQSDIRALRKEVAALTELVKAARKEIASLTTKVTELSAKLEGKEPTV